MVGPSKVTRLTASRVFFIIEYTEFVLHVYVSCNHYVVSIEFSPL